MWLSFSSRFIENTLLMKVSGQSLYSGTYVIYFPAKIIYMQFMQVISLTVKLEYCLVEGLLSFLATTGPALSHLSSPSASDHTCSLLSHDQPATRGNLFNHISPGCGSVDTCFTKHCLLVWPRHIDQGPADQEPRSDGLPPLGQEEF